MLPIRFVALAVLLLAAGASAFRTLPPVQAAHLRSSARQLVAPLACTGASEPAAPVETYTEAEARGFELYRSGEYERAVRMFELAQTLPGEGYDYQRAKSGGMIGSSGAPPNPRELEIKRFATSEQKMIAQYNIACCYAAMGDGTRCVEILRTYLAQVGEPLNQLNEMLVDEDLVSVRAQLREVRDEYKTGSKTPGLFGIPVLKNPLRDIAESIGVEWKD